MLLRIAHSALVPLMPLRWLSRYQTAQVSPTPGRCQEPLSCVRTRIPALGREQSRGREGRARISRRPRLVDFSSAPKEALNLAGPRRVSVGRATSTRRHASSDAPARRPGNAAPSGTLGFPRLTEVEAQAQLQPAVGGRGRAAKLSRAGLEGAAPAMGAWAWPNSTSKGH